MSKKPKHEKPKNPLRKFTTPPQDRTTTRSRLAGVLRRAADRAEVNDIYKRRDDK